MKMLLLFLLLLPSTLFAQFPIITTSAGGGTDGPGSLAVNAIIHDPAGIVFDSAGNYYFVQVADQIIGKVSNSGIYTVFAGNGTGGFSGDGGLATDATLQIPEFLAVGPNGNIYFADAGNNRVREVNIVTNVITTVAGNGTAGFSGDGGDAGSAELNYPFAVCFDKIGNLYIADQNNYRIREVDVTGVITTYAGTGSFGIGEDGGLADTTQIGLVESLNCDTGGNVYYAEGNVVKKINSITTTVSTIAGNGSTGIIGNGGPATDAEFVNIFSIYIDSKNELYIADAYGQNVRVVDTIGIIHLVAGTGVAGYSGDGGADTSAVLHDPEGIAADKCGNLYICDQGNNRIRKVTINTSGTPAINISSPDVVVCAGTPVTCSATVTGSSTFAYQWMVNGVLVSTAGSNYTYIPSNDDSVRCIFAGTGQCSGYVDTVSSNTLYMVVTPIVSPTIILSGPSSASVGSTIMVTAEVADAGATYNLNWYNNGTLFATSTTLTVTCSTGSGVNMITATVFSTTGGCYDSTTSAALVVSSNNINVSNVIAGGISVYPNPAHEVIVVKGNDVTNVNISNTIGQTQINKDVFTDEVTVDIASLPVGVYLVKVTGSNGVKVVQKIIRE